MMATLDLEAFRKLQLMTAMMQENAEAGEWDSFSNMQQNCAEAVANLPALDYLTIADSERAELVSVLKEIQTSLNTMMPLALAQKVLLSRELEGIRNSTKLSQAYLLGNAG